LLELFLPLFPPDIEFNTLLELRSYGTYVSKEDVSVGLLTLLFVSSALSLIIGTVLGLAQTKIKRLLAYSTISHIGFILLALGVQSSDSIESLIFYIIQYTITNLNIFLILITLSLIYNNIQNNKGKSVGGHTVTGGEDIE
jgi:NADH-ubiquinone oxidoreductase chain 2